MLSLTATLTVLNGRDMASSCTFLKGQYQHNTQNAELLSKHVSLDSSLFQMIYSLLVVYTSWLSCPQKFLKPVTLEIEHCASFQDSSQFSSLRFIVANSSQGKLPYQFRVLEQGTFVHSYGSIQVSQFSFFGISILKRIWRSWLPTYYSRLHYIQKDVNTWDVDYVITLQLQAALTVSQFFYVVGYSNTTHALLYGR